MKQKKNNFSLIEVKKTGIHALKVGLAAILVVVLQYIQTHSFGSYDILIPIVSTSITALVEYLKGE